jgi:hypothetical protein
MPRRSHQQRQQWQQYGSHWCSMPGNGAVAAGRWGGELELHSYMSTVLPRGGVGDGGG